MFPSHTTDIKCVQQGDKNIKIPVKRLCCRKCTQWKPLLNKMLHSENLSRGISIVIKQAFFNLLSATLIHKINITCSYDGHIYINQEEFSHINTSMYKYNCVFNLFCINKCVGLFYGIKALKKQKEIPDHSFI